MPRTPPPDPGQAAKEAIESERPARASQALLVSIAPALPVEVFCSVMLGIPLSTFEEIIANGDGPRMFLIGRRRYITKQDGLDWIEELRESRPYVRSIRQRKAAASTPNATE